MIKKPKKEESLPLMTKKEKDKYLEDKRIEAIRIARRQGKILPSIEKPKGQPIKKVEKPIASSSKVDLNATDKLKKSSSVWAKDLKISRELNNNIKNNKYVPRSLNSSESVGFKSNGTENRSIPKTSSERKSYNDKKYSSNDERYSPKSKSTNDKYKPRPKNSVEDKYSLKPKGILDYDKYVPKSSSETYEKYSPKSKNLPPDIKRRDDRNMPMRNKRQVIESDSDEYDSKLDDFIVDGPEEATEDYTKVIFNIFKYDKTKYRRIDEDDECMESDFHTLQKVEYLSSRAGLLKDLTDIRKEKAMLKRRKKN